MKTARASMTPIPPGGDRAAQSRAVQGMDKGERAGPGEPVHVPKSPELLRVGSSSVFYVFAGHVGGSVAFDFGSSRK
jgi:hypothetical protein